MQNHGNIQRIIVVAILNIIVFVFLIAVSNFTYAQFLHNQTLYEITKQTPTQIAHITVGQYPSGIDDDDHADTIYVTNRNDNTVSVIDGTNDTVIGKPIPVGKSRFDIAVIRKFIHVGKSLYTLYVTNFNDNDVSVIDGATHTVIGRPIPVGKSPFDIALDSLTNTLYVTNFHDNAVSVIDGAVNKVVARVMFNIKPFNSGDVVCDNTTDKGKWNAPLKQHSGSGCTAKPYPGFEFVSWEDNLGKNEER